MKDILNIQQEFQKLITTGKQDTNLHLLRLSAKLFTFLSEVVARYQLN